MAVGWCVNAAMVEISINSIFAAYFGLFFCALAGVIAVRVSAFPAGAHRPALLVLAALMGVSGLLCLAYQRHWFFSLGGGARVPIYALIGATLAFSLTFATAELLNYAAGAGGSGIGGGSGGGAARANAAPVQTPTSTKRTSSSPPCSRASAAAYRAVVSASSPSTVRRLRRR